jgi:hypothetical protein
LHEFRRNVGLDSLIALGKGVGVASSWILSNPQCVGCNGIVALLPA